MEPPRARAKLCYEAWGPTVSSTPVEVPAAARARWLAELSGALEDATDVLRELPLVAEHSSTVVELQMRIRVARAAVDSLRLGREAREQLGPRRTNLIPWDEPDGMPR